MGNDAGGGCKRFHGGKFFRTIFALVAIAGLFYGALYRVKKDQWPWEDWKGFLHFSKTSTQTAFEKGKEFTRDKVLPKTRELLAKAEKLLEEMDTEGPAPAKETADEVAQEPEREPGEEPLELAGAKVEDEEAPAEAVTAEEEMGAAEVVPAAGGEAISVEQPAKKPAPGKAPEQSDSWRKGRAKFKEGLRHYQQTAPDMEHSREELAAAQADFRESQKLLEEAERADPDNHLIEQDLQRVQEFLVDCQRRMTLEPRTY